MGTGTTRAGVDNTLSITFVMAEVALRPILICVHLRPSAVESSYPWFKEGVEVGRCWRLHNPGRLKGRWQRLAGEAQNSMLDAQGKFKIGTQMPNFVARWLGRAVAASFPDGRETIGEAR